MGIVTDMESTRLFFSVYRGSFTDFLFYFRLIGHVLGHADWGHFINNFLIILLIGPLLEAKYGSRNLVKMFLITALVTGVFHVVFFNSVLLGASGIVYMLILLSPFANNREGSIPLTLVFVAAIYIGREIIDGLVIQDDISQLTHIIGAICGCFFGFTTRGKSK